jgi:hypothetical protein
LLKTLLLETKRESAEGEVEIADDADDLLIVDFTTLDETNAKTGLGV